MSDATGFLAIDKEQGWTSHDVVAKLRKHVTGKVGHAGTLDPMATGLLIIGVGRATRLLRFVQAARKVYFSTALFGVATDSLDADGSVLSREPLPVDAEQVEAAMGRFRGEIVQVPPMVSARKVEGRRLYELAREGKVVEREARPVTIHELDLIDLAPSDYPEVTFRTVCSTGTYVRTLADDLARSLGGRAHLTALRRTANGGVRVEEAHTVEAAIASLDDSGDVVISPMDALAGMPVVSIDEATAFRVRNGRPLEGEHTDVAEDEFVRIAGPDGALMAVYRRSSEKLVPEVVLS